MHLDAGNILFCMAWLMSTASCGCLENGTNHHDAREDGDLDGEEDAPDRYEGPLAELWDGKIPINVFGSNREFIDFPTVVEDRSGGMVVSGSCIYCYDPVEGTRRGVVLQRISSSGEKLWGENGIFVPQGGIGGIFPLADSSSYVLGGYTNDADEKVYYFSLMHPDGTVDIDKAYYFTENELPFDSIVRGFVTHDELLFVSIEQTDTETEGYWCFLGLDRELNSWTGGIQCLFPKSDCEGYFCLWDESCGNVNAMLLGIVEDPDGNFVFLFQKSESNSMEPGEIYAQTYDRELNQLGDPGCYGSLIGTFDYLCEATYPYGNYIFCLDKIESDQFTPELIETLGGETYAKLEYVLKFGSESSYAPLWTPYTTDFLFLNDVDAFSNTNMDGNRGGYARWVKVIPDGIGGAYVFGYGWREEECGQTCPADEHYIQHLDDQGRTTYGKGGKIYVKLARTPSDYFSLIGVVDFSHVTADDEGNLFYAWLHPINPVDTDWPVDQPIPWGWAYRVCVQKATSEEVNVWPGDPHPCVEVMRYSDILYDTVNSKPLGGLVPDGEGGAIVVFIGAEGKFYAQRVGADGQLMWDARE